MRRAAICGAVVCVTGLAPAQNLWDLFSRTFTTNVLAWTRYNDNPVLGPAGSTWKHKCVGSPEILTFQKRTLLFYRGTGIMAGTSKGSVDRIGVVEVSDIGAGRLTYRELNNGLPVLDIGSPGSFDRSGVSTPAAVVFKGQIHLYYTGTADSTASIGLAVSTDAERFVKVGRVLDGQSPDLIVHGDTLYMVYQKLDVNGFKIFIAYSTDGRTFTKMGNRPVFAGMPGQWDAQSITTPRLWRSGEWTYMLYGGSSGAVDEPEFFGLARSKDMIHWERHPGNPVFGAGIHGGPDGGDIWTPAVFENDTWIILLYEGSIGHHSWEMQSSICMAWVPKR
jgi:predicted GH43/DUF377 family glycosyl hydrolase